jgi:cytochrome c553
MPIPSDTIKLCSLCHEAMPGRPRTQPQVEIAQHSSGQQCIVCHNPHSPKIVAAAVMVAGDAAAGAKHAAACASCHGANGISPNDTWPNLAGQHAVYLARILGAYKSGEQKDVMMTPIAQSLSNADVQNLAAHYGGLSCKAAPAKSDIGDAAVGKALANNCTACHGETGIASNPAWPSLAGQKPAYLMNALKAFRAGLRQDPMMAGVARSLSDTDIANLAAYYAGQSCSPATR